MKIKRKSGILLHPTSLPGGHGIGDFGPAAYRFIDFLKEAKQTLWQILPLTPTGFDGCPYNSHSAFAGNPLLISLDLLVEEGVLQKNDIPPLPHFDVHRVSYDAVRKWKEAVLAVAYNRFRTNDTLVQDFVEFCKREEGWLEEFALYTALKNKFGTSMWIQWPKEFKFRIKKALRAFARIAEAEIERHKFFQWLFFKQWQALRAYANERGIAIIGDIPIFVSYDSADVWSNQDFFLLEEGERTLVSGVPPDYFSPTGQLWGNPLYDWDRMREDGFGWWKRRFAQSLRIFDIVRIDHFRGFSACWAVNGKEKTAENGQWLYTPGNELFSTLRDTFDELPFIAEDLGDITEDVIELRNTFGFPGMKILQFAFSDPANPFLPHNIEDHRCVIYTGTHDNNTTLGWYSSLQEYERTYINRYLNMRWGDPVNWSLISAAFASSAETAIIPMHDITGLHSEARFNTPGTVSDRNWSWRFTENEFRIEDAWKLAELSWCFYRNQEERKKNQ